MSRTSPSILLLNEAPDSGWDKYLPAIGIAACLYFLIGADAQFSRYDRLDAVIGPQAVVERIAGTVFESSDRRSISYVFQFDGKTVRHEYQCHRVSAACRLTKPGPAVILASRVTGYSLPESLLRSGLSARKSTLFRGRIALGMAFFLLAASAFAYHWLGRR